MPFVINSRGSDDVLDGGEFEAIRNAFQTWEDVPTSFITFRDQGLTESGMDKDGLNSVVFDETGGFFGIPLGAGVIAVTRVHSRDDTGEITEADIVFNGVEFTFTTSGRTGRGTMDIQEVATHEIGHLLGLDHTGLSGPPSITPTMNPFPSRGGRAEGRTLEADDIAGVSTIYPTPDFLTNTGSISGTVKSPDGSSVFGAHVVAYDALTKSFLVSCLSGFRTGPGGDGEYTIFGLAPGDYLVAIEPLHGDIDEDNFGGIFDGFDTGFPREFFDNATGRDGAEVVSVRAGEDTPDVNFITTFLKPGSPVIADLSDLPNTDDTIGPYVITVRITDDEGIAEALLFFRVNGGDFQEVPLRRLPEGEAFEGGIPGQPVGTTVEYFVQARDTDGNTTLFPFGAPSATYRFEVFELTGLPLAYIAARRSNDVSVIDTGTNVEVNRIPVGRGPIGMAITPNDSLVYVTNAGSNDVTVIETVSNSVLTTIPVEGSPLDLVVTSDGEKVYVSNSGSNSVSVIDVGSNEVIATIPIPSSGRGPYGVAISPDDSRLYLTSIEANTVSVVETATNSIVSTIDVVEGPRSVAITPDGAKVYVTSFSGDGISVIDAETDTILKTIDIAPASSAFEIAISLDGTDAYVTGREGNNVIVIDLITDTVKEIIPSGGLNPRGVAITEDGLRAFVSNQDSDDVVVIDTASNRAVAVFKVGEGPRDIVIQSVRPAAGIAEESVSPGLPKAFFLGQNFPNPFNLTTTLKYQIPRRSWVELLIYNVLGQRVRTLVEGIQHPGSYSVRWDGTDDDGRDVASGVYVYVMRVGDEFRRARRMVLLR